MSRKFRKRLEYNFQLFLWTSKNTQTKIEKFHLLRLIGNISAVPPWVWDMPRIIIRNFSNFLSYLEISKNFNRDPLEIDNAEWQSILVARTSKCFFEGKETTSILILARGRSNLKDCSIKKSWNGSSCHGYIEEEWNFPARGRAQSVLRTSDRSQRHDDLRQMMFLFVLVFDRAINLKQVEYS